MNNIEKEVFDALEYEGPEAYENLEDNFVDIANDGEKCLDSKKPIKDLVAEKQQEDLMKELEESEDKLPDIQGVINKHDFNRIVHEYIAHMEKKHEKKAETNNKNPSKKPLKELEEEEERESNPELEDDIKRPDIKPEIMDKIDKDELFTRKMYEKLDPTEDICLQQYLMKDSSDELDTDQEPNTKKIEINSPTIEDNSKNLSLPTPKLNIIKEKYGPRKQKKAKDAKSETTNAENDSNITKIEHKDIFKKREKEETQEEKTERKAKIKTFKNERKEKKKKFKEELKYQQSNELKKNKPNHNIAHVSVYKL